MTDICPVHCKHPFPQDNSGYPVISTLVVNLFALSQKPIKVNGKKQQYAQGKLISLVQGLSVNTKNVTGPW